MANLDVAALQARVQELEAQLVGQPALTQRLKHPAPEKFFGGQSEPTALNWCDQVDAYLTALGHFKALRRPV